jgi:DNA-directed RNA polymerase sigma subunit (sigma70/sigma32)
MTRLGGDSPDPENHLGRYLEEVESYPRLSDDEERALLAVVAASGIGREFARRRVIEANLRLAVEVARGYQSTGRHLLDLIQEGNLGLLSICKRSTNSRHSRGGRSERPLLQRFAVNRGTHATARCA